MTKWDLPQKCKVGLTNLFIIYHIDRIKDPNHMVISKHTEKAFDKIQHLFVIKTFQRVGIEGTCLNIIKAIYGKPITNIVQIGRAHV